MTALPIDNLPASPYDARELDNTGADPRHRAPLVVGDAASFHAITERICYVAEAPRPPTGVVHRVWGGVYVFEHHGRDDRVFAVYRRGRVGNEPAEHVGVRYYELRVLGRYRARGHADLGDFVFVPAEVADGD